MRVLEAAGRASASAPLGGLRLGLGALPPQGSMMPADGLDLLRPFDAVYFGAVGDPRIQDQRHPRRAPAADPARLRPVRLRAPGGPAPRAPARRWPGSGPETSTSWWCARTPRGSTRRWEAPSTRGSRTRWRSRRPSSPAGARRGVIRFAFELARGRGARARRLTSMTKSNAQGLQHGLLGPSLRGGRGGATRTSPRSRCWWTPRAWTSSGAPRASTWWSPRTSSATSSPTWPRRSPGVWVWRRART